MTQTIRWLTALALLLAVGVCAVRAEEEEEVTPTHQVAELLPPPLPTAAVMPYPGGPIIPAAACSMPCPYPLSLAPIRLCSPFGPPCATCPLCPACAATACTEPTEYVVRTKLIRAGDDQTTACPCLTVTEGQPATIQISGVASAKEQSSLQMQVCVTKVGGGASLGLSCTDSHCVSGGHDGVRAHTETTEIQCPVTCGQVKKVELTRDSDGSPQSWVEVTVTEVEQELRKANTADAEDSALDDVTDVVQGVFEIVADAAASLFGGEVQQAAYTMPNSQYLQTPPQYFPAAPAQPMARELSASAQCPCGAAGCTKVVTAAAVGQCDGPSACGVGCCPCAAFETVRQSAAHVSIDASHDRKSVAIDAGKKQLRASADRVTMHDDSIVLEGDVRAEWCSESGGDQQIKAAKLRVDHKDGGLTIQIEE